MEALKFDVVILGAGPAGCIAAFMLSGKGLKIALVEKDIFPREKICGDAFGADVSRQFHLIDEKLTEKLYQFTNKITSNGVRFYSPNHKAMDIEFAAPEDKFGGGFVAKRLDFDNFYFTEIAKLPDVKIFQNQLVTEVASSPEKILLKTSTSSFEAKMALGADGAHSILNKRLTENRIEKKHYCAGLRSRTTISR